MHANQEWATRCASVSWMFQMWWYARTMVMMTVVRWARTRISSRSWAACPLEYEVLLGKAPVSSPQPPSFQGPSTSSATPSPLCCVREGLPPCWPPCRGRVRRGAASPSHLARIRTCAGAQPRARGGRVVGEGTMRVQLFREPARRESRAADGDQRLDARCQRGRGGCGRWTGRGRGG